MAFQPTIDGGVGQNPTDEGLRPSEEDEEEEEFKRAEYTKHGHTPENIDGPGNCDPKARKFSELSWTDEEEIKRNSSLGGANWTPVPRPIIIIPDLVDDWNIDSTTSVPTPKTTTEPTPKEGDIIVYVRGTYTRYEVVLSQHATLQDLESALKKQTGFKLKKSHFFTDKSKYVYPFVLAAHEGYTPITTLHEVGIRNHSTISAVENVRIL